jgi:hypothetical protein
MQNVLSEKGIVLLMYKEIGMVAHFCNLSYSGGRLGGGKPG